MLYQKEAFSPSIGFPNEAGVFQLDAFPDLTAFIVLSEEPHVVQANFASTPNASAITSTTNTSTITKEHREICRDEHCMRKNRSS